jgi:hypothetical protein
VKIRIDESGDFDFSSDRRFWVAVVAGVVIPDDRWAAVEAWVDAYNQLRGTEEIKAKDLDESELVEAMEFLVSEEILAGAIATDSRVFPYERQLEWRGEQFEIFEEAVERSQRARRNPEVRARVERLRRRMDATRHISTPDYLQYAILMPWLLGHLMKAALTRYRSPAYASDSWAFDIVLDEKGGADPGKAGQLLRDSVEAIFASDPRTELALPAEWSGDHPFLRRHTDPERGTVTVPRVLAGGIRAAQSHRDPGLQLADLVSHLVWRAVRDPDDTAAAKAWRALGKTLSPTDDGWPIKVWAREPAGPEDEARYLGLAKALLEGS